MRHETDAGGVDLRHSHERLHDFVGDNGHLFAAAVFHQIQAEEVFGQHFLHLVGVSLYEDKSGDGGAFDFADAFVRLFVSDAFMDENRKAFFKLLIHHVYFGLMDKKITPRLGLPGRERRTVGLRVNLCL